MFQSAGLTAFAQKDGNAYVTENLTGTIYQVAKGDKWLDVPIVVAKDLKNPEGITVGNDGNLLVLESNEDEEGGHNGRLTSVDVKTGKCSLLYSPLGLSKKLNPEMFTVLHPHATLGQTADRAIYLYEPLYGVQRA